MDSVVDSLEMATEFLMRTRSDPTKSKWLSFALYHALYISCISALNISNPDTVVKGKRGQLLSFSEALELVQDPCRMKQYVHSKALKLPAERRVSLDRLRDYRDFHWHMKPTGILEAPLRPEVVGHTIDCIEFLVFESGNIQLYEEDRTARMKQVLKKIKESMKDY